MTSGIHICDTSRGKTSTQSSKNVFQLASSLAIVEYARVQSIWTVIPVEKKRGKKFCGESL
jgi:hypothetical protein